MRAVADTNIVVSGLFWQGAPRRVLDVVSGDSHLLVLARYRGIRILTASELTLIQGA
jgi:predicted nucleic acid-binding protein